MQSLVRSIFVLAISSGSLFADHAPDVRNGGSYPEGYCVYVGYTRQAWNGFVYTANAPYGDVTLGGYYIQGLANDFSNTIVLARGLYEKFDTTFGNYFVYEDGVFNTRHGWTGWNFSAPYCGMIAIHDPDAGALNQDSNDVVATTHSGANNTTEAYVAYWRPGWATINLAGVSGYNPVKLSIPCPLLQANVRNTSDLHMQINYISGNMEIIVSKTDLGKHFSYIVRPNMVPERMY